MKVACRFLVPLVACLASAQVPAPLATLKTTAYTLYAKSENEIAESRPDLDFAVSQFQYYFGEQPPPITVLIFDSTQELQNYDFSSLKKSHQRYLAWLSPGGLASAAASMAPIPGLGIIISNASQGVKVAAVLPLPQLPADLRKDDIITALNSQKCSSVQEFQSRYGALEPGAKIDLRVTRAADEQVAFSFAKPASDAKVSQASTKPASAGGIKALSHEAGHTFFEAWVDEKIGRAAEIDHPSQGGPPTGEISYGHPAVPAWFNEAVATLLESPQLQKSRYDFLAHHMQDAIPLPNLFTMKHPVVTDRQEALKQAQAAAVNNGGTSVVVMQTDNDSTSQRETLFYAESLSIAQFMAAEEGPIFIGRVAEGLAKGRTMQEILHDAKNLPADSDQLAKTWRQWLAARSAKNSVDVSERAAKR